MPNEREDPKAAPAPPASDEPAAPRASEPPGPHLPAADEDDPKEYSDYTPEQRVAYLQAKLAYAQAYSSFATVKAAALAAFRKPYDDFRSAFMAKKAADRAYDEATAEAGRLLTEVANVASELTSADLGNPAAGKTAVSGLQAAVDAYKGAVATVAVRQSAAEAARDALAKVANAKGDDVNEDRQRLAQEQYELDVAKAAIPLQAASGAFQAKRKELESLAGPGQAKSSRVLEGA